MVLPNLSVQQVAEAIPSITNVAPLDSGGQKLVFRATLDGKECALKFSLLPAEEADEWQSADVAVRANREFEIMRDCASRYVVKPGPISLTYISIHKQPLIYFSEEFIDGANLKTILQKSGPVSSAEIQRLGLQMSDAIQELWNLGKIHRDIKPGNIMRRTSSGDYVLLDAGLAFDVTGESLSAGLLVGTLPYFSPEQFDYSSRRVLDFRSDMFSLGVTLYELLTGKHPFWRNGDTQQSLFRKITTENPPPPSTVVNNVSPDLDAVVLRMLGKSPHLRYRKMDQLTTALRNLRGIQ